jgi:hypothetical protein
MIVFLIIKIHALRVKGIKKFFKVAQIEIMMVYRIKLDKCPDTPGIVKFQGCPDRDNDSVPDYMDDCPDTPGLVKFKGCPDPNEASEEGY